MKKVFIAMATAIALAGTLTLAACSKSSSPNANKFDDLTTAKAVYGFSAASAGMIISDMNEATPEQGAPEQTNPEQGAPEQTNPEQGAESAGNHQLDGYMTLVESLLSDGGFKTVSQTSDRAEYTEKVVVTYRDMQNEQNSYIMYYNQILTEAEVDEDETEETYDITGIMLIDDTEYPIRGEREIETEGNESEVETEFRVQISDNSYVLVQQSEEIEEGETEQEFSYSIYENGKLKERSTFEYEEEHGETETEREYVYSIYRGGSLVERASVDFETENENGRTETEYELGILRNGERTTYEVERAERANGTVTIGVNYRLASGERGSFVITQTADGLSYAFDDGGRIDFDDDRDDRDDRDDWDDDWDD